MLETEDETALFAALFDGFGEEPLWHSFLDRLRVVTRADFSTLRFRLESRPFPDGIFLTSGAGALPWEKLFSEYFAPGEAPGISLPEGVPHSMQDVLDSVGPERAEAHRKFLAQFRIGAIRELRVREGSGVDAWLGVTRRGNDDFPAEVDDLLSRIAPVLRSALQLFLSLDRERFAAVVTADAIHRLQFGWLSLDRDGRVIDGDDQGYATLATSGVLQVSAAGRLQIKPAEIEREILGFLKGLSESPRTRPRAFTLSQNPWLDMLLVPAQHQTVATKARAAAIAYVHGDSWQSDDLCDQIADLFAISPSEARLALALSRGMSMAEAAEHFGWTTTTVRTYSKSIYAKTGARGLPDLVRLIMRSIIAFVPS